MTIIIDTELVFAGTETVTLETPQIEGTWIGTQDTINNTIGITQSTAIAPNRYGFRLPLNNQDFSTHEYTQFTMHNRFANFPVNLTSVDTGGIRIVFIDDASNYKGFNLYGNDIPEYSFLNVGDGFFVHAVPVGSSAAIAFYVARNAVPAINSVNPINLSNIVAIELTFNLRVNAIASLYIGGICKVNNISVINNNETFNTIVKACQIQNPISHRDYNRIAKMPLFHEAGLLKTFTLKNNLNIGDGITSTNFNIDNTTLGFYNTWTAPNIYRRMGPIIQLPSNNERWIRFNQSASDVTIITDSNISSGAYWQFLLSGNGSLSATRSSFWRFDKFECKHGIYTECIWDFGTAPIEISGNTQIIDGIVRNGHGINILGSPGDYSHLTLKLDDNTLDVTLGTGGTGNYNLAGLTVPSNYTLKLHNNSSNNISIELAQGIDYTTTTDGGLVTVTQAVLSTTWVNEDLEIDTAILIVNATTNTTILYTKLTTVGYTVNLIPGTDYQPGDVIEVRQAKQETNQYYIEKTSTIITVESGGTIVEGGALEVCPICTQLGLTGSNYNNKFELDYIDNELDIVIAGDWQVGELISWWKWKMTQQSPMESFWGAWTLQFDGSFLNNVNQLSSRLDTTQALDCVETSGRRIYRSDGTRPIKSPTSGGGNIDCSWREPVSVVAVGSGVTNADISAIRDGLAQEATVAAIPTNPVLATDARLDNIGSIDAQDITDALTSYQVAKVSDLPPAPDNTSIASIKSTVEAIPTNPLLATDSRLDNIGSIDTQDITDALTSYQVAKVSDLPSEPDNTSIASIKATVEAIPTNPLLATDSRLDNIGSIDASDITDALTSYQVAKVSDLPPAPDNTSITSIKATVEAIPTNPLLVTDSRLDNIGSIDTQDITDALTSYQVAKASDLPPAPDNTSIASIKTTVEAIPTNPLLATDSRLDNYSTLTNENITEVLTDYNVAKVSDLPSEPNNDAIALIKDKTDNLPPDPASEASVQEAKLAAQISAALNA